MIPATVTQVTPLRVRVDGAASDSPAVLSGGAATLGARVYVFPNTSPLLVSGQGISSANFATAAGLAAEIARATAAEAALASAGGSTPFATMLKLGVDA